MLRTKLPSLLFGILTFAVVLGSVPKTFAVFAQSLTTSTEATSHSWGDAVSGVQMSIFQDPTFQGTNAQTHLVVAFHNVGQNDETFLTGGGGCGWPPQDLSSFTKLNLTDEQGVPHRHLPYWGDGPPYSGGFCAGASGAPNIVTLHPGNTVSLPLSLGKYLDLSDAKQYGMYRFHPGVYSVQAELIGSVEGLKGMPIYSTLKATEWTGTVKSNILRIYFDTEFAAPLGDLPK